MNTRRITTSLIGLVVGIGSLMVAAPVAQAHDDAMPVGFTISDDFVYPSLWWSKQGQVTGSPGNWHTGRINIDESDDWIERHLADWQCPKGTRPPAQLGETTRCTTVGAVYFDDADPKFLNDLQTPQDFTRTHDWVTHTYRVSGEVEAKTVSGDEPVMIALDMTWKGNNSPLYSRTITPYPTAELLEQSSRWGAAEVKVWGRIDEQRIGRRFVTQEFKRLDHTVTAERPL